LEGNTTELFTLRNIHKNSIFGALTSIALDYQVPLLNSKDSNETAQILYVIAKREQKTNNKEVRIRVGRKGLTLSEQQRFIIEGFPSVGPNLAKALLEKFGSIKNIVNASEKELQELENLGKKKANLIQKVLREKYDENKSTLKELEGDKELDDEEIQKAFDENNSNSNEEEVIIDEE
ncbi:MAG: helix-hairpin-helix domain-containing protein, partial [Candidatus ainarchaeum sp.]|nr:helix-hairpin-helix domain-containing protein [Candidatus ainarchaeum sp.]